MSIRDSPNQKIIYSICFHPANKGKVSHYLTTPEYLLTNRVFFPHLRKVREHAKSQKGVCLGITAYVIENRFHEKVPIIRSSLINYYQAADTVFPSNMKPIPSAN